MSADYSTAAAAAAFPGSDADAVQEASVRDYWALLKPRVMSLSIFTAFVGMVAAPDAVHPVVALGALLCVAVGAGAAGALNMWWDADIDRVMRRTLKRPVPQGRVSASDALHIGVGLSIISVTLLALFGGFVAAALLALTIAYYLFIYTMWLKRRTPQNIVVGGAAGAFPPMIGWAVATGGVSTEAVILFALIFLWTPPHSWALALFARADYARAGVPMLPVAAGDAETRRQIWLYSLGLTVAAAAPLATSLFGPIYLATAVLMTGRLLQLAWRLRRRTADQAEADGFGAEKRFFGFTILYLFAAFLALAADALLRALI